MAPTDIDRAAPVIAHHEIDIEASPELVWRAHADVNAWPSWHPDITEAPSGTHVTTNESFAGEPVEADSASMQRLLDASLQAWLEHLKQAAEAQN